MNDCDKANMNTDAAADDDDMLASQTNLVLQINRSHLERMVEFLNAHSTTIDDKKKTLTILTTKKSTASKSCSLIFLHATNAKSSMEHLLNRYKFILLGLNKIYIMNEQRSLIRGYVAPIKESDVMAEHKSGYDDTAQSISHHIYNMLLKLKQRNDNNSIPTSKNDNNGTATKKAKHNEKDAIKVKLDVYPASLQSLVVSNITALLDGHDIPESVLDVSPSNQTHNLSIVQIDTAEEINNNKSTNDGKIGNGTFLIGIASCEQTVSPISNPINNPDDICRAYYKLSEVFERYQPNGFQLKDRKGGTNSQRPIIAVDCGSAPGGWTKYIIEQTECEEVYSIDPGELAESISSMPNVHHMKMTAEKAIPILRDNLSQSNASIALWVSDMCVHEIPKQVNMFLRAYEAKLFEPDAAFVLTIKCNVGHAKEQFDQLAEEQADRLRNHGAYDMQMMHLFSNRIGERTIVGFIK